MLEEGVVKYVIIRIIIFFEFFEMSVFFVFKIFLYYCIVNVNSLIKKNLFKFRYYWYNFKYGLVSFRRF